MYAWQFRSTEYYCTSVTFHFDRATCCASVVRTFATLPGPKCSPLQDPSFNGLFCLLLALPAGTPLTVRWRCDAAERRPDEGLVVLMHLPSGLSNGISS